MATRTKKKTEIELEIAFRMGVELMNAPGAGDISDEECVKHAHDVANPVGCTREEWVNAFFDGVDSMCTNKIERGGSK